jgi:hypothetical protein
MSWYRIQIDEFDKLSYQSLNDECEYRLKWVTQQYDWNDGSRSCFVNVWAPCPWLALLIGSFLIKKSGATGRRWR